jgi:hypothetical protein
MSHKTKAKPLTVTDLARKLRRDRTTLNRRIIAAEMQPAEVAPDGTSLYMLEDVRRMLETVPVRRVVPPEVHALKEQRLQQQIRKDRIANDLKEGLLMRRAEWAAACAVGGTRWNGFVARYRSEFPAHHAKAADSLPEQRAVVDMAIGELSAFLIPMLDVGKAPRKAVEEAAAMLQARLAEMPIENPAP